MIVDMGSVILSLAGIFLLYLICRVFITPLKWLLRLVFSCILGSGAIWAFNWLFAGLGWHLAINPLTAMTAGVLGLPGMIMAQILAVIL